MNSPLPMIVDSFAGGGGASTGIELALGRSPDVAINHSAAALALHAANHPDTIHLDSNIWDVSPLEVTKGRHLGLLWASPDCKHFSKAKGGAPKDRNIRDLAWVIVRWMEEAKPDVVAMENVEEFRTWGPLDNDGQPIPEFIGQTFDDWCKRIRKAGYRMQWRELRACDYGAPTIRKRFFMIARRDGRPIVWPKPTHGDPKSEAVRKGKLLPWRTAAECIDWSLPCPSIFDTAPEIMAQHGLRAVRPLKPNTLARVARGVKRYVLDAQKPFLVSLKGSARRDRGVDQPHSTVLAGGGHSALISPSIARFNGGATGWDLQDPAPTVLAKGGPLGIIAPSLVSVAHGDSGGRREYPLTDPFGVVLSGGITHAVIAPHVMTMRNSGKPFQGADEPTHTITAGGAGLTLVAPVITYAQHGGQVRDPLAPMHTIAASRKDQNSLIAPYFAKYYGTGDGARHDEPAHTITVKDRFAHVQASLAAPPFTEAHHERARAVAEFLRSHGAWDGGEFVTLEIDGQTFVIADIGMRMLSPRELFNAQGFPFWQETYKFSGWRDHTIRPEAGPGSAFGRTVPARSAERFFPWSSPLDQREHVAASARIDLGQMRLVVSSPERSPFAALNAVRTASFPLPTEIVDTVRQLVQHRKTAAQAMGTGAAGRPANGKPSTHQSLGALLAMQSGDVTVERAADAGGHTSIQSVALRSTTSQAGPLSQTCVSILQTLSYYVADVIASSTLGKTCQVSLFDVDLTIDASYVIDGVWQERDGDWHWHPFAKDVQVSCCGNSVCPDLARALIEANCAHLKAQAERAAA